MSGDSEIKKYNTYPKLKKINENSYYLGLLQNLYSDADSELSGLLQFQYQYFLVKEFNDDLAKILEKIISQDYKHLEMLADAITKLGGDPKFYNARREWLSTRSVDYVKSVKQIIKMDIEIKEKSVIDYKLAIAKISNDELTAYLNRIVLDEKNHLKVLKSYNETII